MHSCVPFKVLLVSKVLSPSSVSSSNKSSSLGTEPLTYGQSVRSTEGPALAIMLGVGTIHETEPFNLWGLMLIPGRLCQH